MDKEFDVLMVPLVSSVEMSDSTKSHFGDLGHP